MVARTLPVLATLLLATPALAQDGDATKGAALYKAKCSACHGPEGGGDGPAAGALPRPPADLRSADFWTRMTDERLRDTITKGKPGTAMRPFPMSDDNLSNLTAYLRSLQPE